CSFCVVLTKRIFQFHSFRAAIFATLFLFKIYRWFAVFHFHYSAFFLSKISRKCLLVIMPRTLPKGSTTDAVTKAIFPPLLSVIGSYNFAPFDINRSSVPCKSSTC